MVWPPILMLCSVTEDSSFGGAAGAASAGLSAGLASLSCARAVMAIAVMDKASASSTLRFFTRIIFLASEQTGICDFGEAEILPVSMKPWTILFDGRGAKSLRRPRRIAEKFRRSHRRSNPRQPVGVLHRLRWCVMPGRALPQLCRRGCLQEHPR